MGFIKSMNTCLLDRLKRKRKSFHCESLSATDSFVAWPSGVG